MKSITKIALSAAVVLGSATAAFAGDVPEHRLTDRYPFLQMNTAPIAKHAAMKMTAWQGSSLNQVSDVPEHRLTDRFPFLAANQAGSVKSNVWQVASVNAITSDVPENRITDRYPLLERTAATVAPMHAGVRTWNVRQVSSAGQGSIDVAEEKIGDRYPFLDRANAKRGAIGFATAGRTQKQMKNKV